MIYDMLRSQSLPRRVPTNEFTPTFHSLSSLSFSRNRHPWKTNNWVWFVLDAYSNLISLRAQSRFFFFCLKERELRKRKIENWNGFLRLEWQLGRRGKKRSPWKTICEPIFENCFLSFVGRKEFIFLLKKSKRKVTWTDALVQIEKLSNKLFFGKKCHRMRMRKIFM